MHWRPEAAWWAVNASTHPPSTRATAGAHVRPGVAHGGSSGRASPTAAPLVAGTLPKPVLVVKAQGTPRSTATNGSAVSSPVKGRTPSATASGTGPAGRFGAAGSTGSPGGGRSPGRVVAVAVPLVVDRLVVGSSPRPCGRRCGGPLAGAPGPPGGRCRWRRRAPSRPT